MRTFIALPLSGADKLAIASWREKVFPALPGAIRPENFHITLAFLGDTAPNTLEAISNMPNLPCKLTLTSHEVGYFSKPGIGFLHIAQCPALQKLRNDLLNQLPSGIKPSDKRDFVPHISLFRNLPEPMPAPLIAPDFSFKINHYTLFESQNTTSGPYYRDLIHWD